MQSFSLVNMASLVPCRVFWLEVYSDSSAVAVVKDEDSSVEDDLSRPKKNAF